MAFNTLINMPFKEEIHFWDLPEENLKNIYCFLDKPEDVRSGANSELFHYKFLRTAISEAGGKIALSRILERPSSTVDHYYSRGMMIPLYTLIKISAYLVSKGHSEYSLGNLEKHGMWLVAGKSEAKFYKIEFPIKLRDYGKFKALAAIISNIIFNGGPMKSSGFELFLQRKEQVTEFLKSFEEFFGGGNSYMRETAFRGARKTIDLTFSVLFGYYLSTLHPLEQLKGGYNLSIPRFLIDCDKIFPRQQSREIWKIILSTALNDITFPQIMVNPPSLLVQHTCHIGNKSKQLMEDALEILAKYGFKKENALGRKLIFISSYKSALLNIMGLGNLGLLQSLNLSNAKRKMLQTTLLFYRWLVEIRYDILETINELSLDNCYAGNILRNLKPENRAVVTYIYYLLAKKKVQFDISTFKTESALKYDFTDREGTEFKKMFSSFGVHLRVLNGAGFLEQKRGPSAYKRHLYSLTDKGKAVLSGKISKSTLGELEVKY